MIKTFIFTIAALFLIGTNQVSAQTPLNSCCNDEGWELFVGTTLSTYNHSFENSFSEGNFKEKDLPGHGYKVFSLLDIPVAFPQYYLSKVVVGIEYSSDDYDLFRNGGDWKSNALSITLGAKFKF